MNDLDRVIHEPTRLRILMILSGVDAADFNFLLSALELTSGNLSSHLDRLEKSGYIEIRKSFQGKIPKTDCRLSKTGRAALANYWHTIDNIRSRPAVHEHKG
ncbi:MAG: transcriptional regulator [Acidobacteriia bacterium]|nr:transcriptional regulator [Terriglobia bacterium]